MTPVVAVDAGGTHARFALAEVGGGRVLKLGEAVVMKTADHASLADAWRAFGQIAGARMPGDAAIAVAATVGGETFGFTNNPWTIRPATLADDLGVDRVLLINDFGAVGHAVAQAPPEDFQVLCGPDVPLPLAGTTSIVGPGTGLGVAHLWRGAGSYRVQATEGGHMDFAPVDAVDDAILARLRVRYGRVSAERVVSGPAIADIYAALAALAGRPEQAMDDRTVWALGLAGGDELAAAAVARFCMSLGSVAGDVALAQGGSAVVIAGGLGLRLRDLLTGSGFSARFRAKGRFEPAMAAMPVKLITHAQPGLFGAAAAFATEHVR